MNDTYQVDSDNSTDNFNDIEFYSFQEETEETEGIEQVNDYSEILNSINNSIIENHINTISYTEQLDDILYHISFLDRLTFFTLILIIGLVVYTALVRFFR